MTENDQEYKGTLAERLAAHTKRVHALLGNVDPYRGSSGDAPETLRPEKRIDGALRSQLTQGAAGPGKGKIDEPPRPSRAVDSTMELGRPLGVALVLSANERRSFVLRERVRAKYSNLGIRGTSKASRKWWVVHRGHATAIPSRVDPRTSDASRECSITDWRTRSSRVGPRGNAC